MDEMIMNLYKQEKGDNFRMSYVNNYVIPTITKFIKKEVRTLEELNIHGYSPIWDTRRNPVIKKILEQLLNVKLTGTVKKDRIVLQKYLDESEAKDA